MPEAHQKIPLTGAWGCYEYPVRSDTLKQTGTWDRIKGQGGTFGNFCPPTTFHSKLSLKRWRSLLKACDSCWWKVNCGSGSHAFASSSLPLPTLSQLPSLGSKESDPVTLTFQNWVDLDISPWLQIYWICKYLCRMGMSWNNGIWRNHRWL